MDQLLLRPEECARAMGISRAKLYELLGSGEIPSITIGRSRRVPADALRRWIETRVANQDDGLDRVAGSGGQTV